MEAMCEYEEHFGEGYPYTKGFGYPHKSDAENIAEIEKCIAENTLATPRSIDWDSVESLGTTI